LALLVASAALVLAAAGDDRSVTEAAITELESNPHTKVLCADAIASSRLALERGRRMRGAGDDRHARLAEGLAREWVRVAQELARADEVESKAAAARVVSNDAGAEVERERATLEQRLAENGRLQAELAKAESRDGGSVSVSSSGSSDGGHK
jgi:transposase-like protein